jgi:hypothetical protein
MTKKILIALTLLFAVSFALWYSMPASASSQPQQIASPTPDENGRVIYIVQENDTCLSIALRFLNGDTNLLRQLNNLDEECLIRPGQELLLGLYEAPTATPGPSPTPTIMVPTPTPYPGSGEICVRLFMDVNGNGMADEGELPIEGGAISITDRENIISLTGTTVLDADPTTTDLEPICFNDIPEGEYNISVGVPEGYNPTTSMNYPLKLKAGDQSLLDFGAQISSAALITQAQPENQRSPLLGILGGGLVLIGIGLGIYIRWLKR